MSKSKSKEGIYSLARQAKERMRKNTYERLDGSLKRTHIVITQLPKPSEKKPDIIIIKNNDDGLYKKVCELIEKGSVNPVKELIDMKVLNTLDLEGKQKYIKSMTDKYKELKNRYFKNKYLRVNCG